MDICSKSMDFQDDDPGTFVAHFQQTVLNKKLNKLFSNKYMSEDL